MASTKKSSAQAWSDELLLALRLRDVPGARIGEVLAEVQSHVAETGEDPRQAFGAADEYADQVAAALGRHTSGGGMWRQLVRSLSWRDLGVAAVVGVACYLLADGLWGLGAGESAVFGIPAGVAVVGALVVLAGCAARLLADARREPGDPVIDPRTGADMVTFPRRAVALLVAVPLLSLAGMLVGGYLTRS